MKSILINCVTYNSYKQLNNYLKTIDAAAGKAKDCCKVDVIIADNSTKREEVNTDYRHTSVEVYTLDNLGYFGGADKAFVLFGVEKSRDYDFVFVSNVDLELEENFFVKLAELQLEENVGWVVPRLYTVAKERDENPMRTTRYSKRELKLLSFMFSHPWLLNLYSNMFRKLVIRNRGKQSNGNTVLACKEIYCGSGAIFMFTKNAAQHIVPLNFPLFLYGEEMFVAESLRMLGLKTVFYPELYVANVDANVSTSTIKKKSLYKYEKDAVDLCLSNFYK